MKTVRPICTLSLDLDNQWSYMKTHGDQGWESFPSYVDVVVPRFLEMLDEFGWKITVFVVGQDAALEKNREALQMIPAAGHEIGNHSFQHEPWLHLYTEDRVRDEISRAEDTIAEATGRRPEGFRGPGYSYSRTTLGVLKSRDYLYDASTFPTFLGPVARAYYFLTSSLPEGERKKRAALFGKLKDGLQPIRPYYWGLGDGPILEIPVSTLPIFKVPVHFSYLLYISTFSRALARGYFRLALKLFKATGAQPSFLLHPLDFLGREDVSALAFFPAMNMSANTKIETMRSFFEILDRWGRIMPLGEFARGPVSELPLPIRTPPPVARLSRD
jgi:hypothetical protein